MRITASWLIAATCVESSSIVIRKHLTAFHYSLPSFHKTLFLLAKGSIYIKYYNLGQILVNQRRILIEYELLRISGSIRTSPFR
jgi:hypothetical protein